MLEYDTLTTRFIEELRRTGSVQATVEFLVQEIADLAWDTYSPVQLAAALGIQEIHYSDLGAIDAYVEYKDKNFEITVNSEKPASRRRFSLCHELGHVLLGHTEGHRSLGNQLRSSQARERLCDEIASNLLMPAPLVNEILEEDGSGLGAVRSISARFGASPLASIFRLCEISADAVKAILWHITPDKVPEVSSVHMTKAAKGHFYLPKGAHAPVQSSVIRALESRRPVIAFESLIPTSHRKYFSESEVFGTSPRDFVVTIVHLDTTRSVT